MGHNVISLGAYTTGGQGAGLRRDIPGLYENTHLREMAIQSSQENIHPELIEWMDACVMMHNPVSSQTWVVNNWDKFKKAKKPVIWRSIGQSTRTVEEALSKYRKEGLKIVRYSPKEANIPGYVGEDAMIRFYADPTDYARYDGHTAQIVNISQALFGSPSVPSRGDHMNIKEFQAVVEGFPWKVFGPDNENAGEHNGGKLSYEDLKQMLRFNRVYLYTGTRPASYTLGGMEAMMAGIPVVSIGPNYGDSIYKDQKTFEMHEIIGESGKAGYWSDDINQLREYCRLLLEDQELAKRVGEAGRVRAIEYFGKDLIANQWQKLFENL